MKPARFALILAATAALAYVSWLKYDAILGVDDAQIAFAYAAHQADGEGFVYNRGGERVEGFTAMLWVLWPLRSEFRIAAEGDAGGRQLRDVFSETRRPTVAVVTAGGVRRTYDGPIFDLMGLNDTRMAHAPGQRTGIRSHAAFYADVFFERTPEIVWAFPRSASGLLGDERSLADFATRVLRDLPSDPRFRGGYRPAEICRDDGPCVRAFHRRDFLDRLSQGATVQVRSAKSGF